MSTNKKRWWTFLAVFFAGMCLVRVLAVWAEEDVEEVYANEHHGAASDSDDADDRELSSIRDAQRAEIRLSTPKEAAARITEEEGQAFVPGARELLAREQAAQQNRAVASSDFAVPTKVGPVVIAGRGIASEAPATQREALPDESARDTELHHTETYSSLLASSAMEQPPLQQVVKTEPLSTRSINPLPDVASRGMQEVSVIVTDTGFYPARVPVISGIPVKVYLTTNAKQTSCFMLDEVGVKKGITPGKVEEVVFTPQGAGTLRFYCPMKSIEGYLVVKEAAESANDTVKSAGRSVASDTRDIDIDDAEKPDYNAPKNAAKLRALIED